MSLPSATRAALKFCALLLAAPMVMALPVAVERSSANGLRLVGALAAPGAGDVITVHARVSRSKLTRLVNTRWLEAVALDAHGQVVASQAVAVGAASLPRSNARDQVFDLTVALPDNATHIVIRWKPDEA